MKTSEERAVNQQQRTQRARAQKKVQDKQLETWQKSKIIENQGIEYQDSDSFQEAYKIMMSRSRAFLCAIDILEDPLLSSNAKVLFFIISMLSLQEGYCYGSDEYLSKKVKTGRESISGYLTELENYGLIKRDTYQTKQGYRRNIHIQMQYIKDYYFKITPETKKTRTNAGSKIKPSTKFLDNIKDI